MKEPAKWRTPAPSAEPRMPRGGFVGLAYFVSKRRAGISGPAMTTEPMPNGAGLAQAETRQAFTEAHLLARRTALIGTARHLRNQMRCSEASTCEAELRAVTHELLAQGDAR